MRTLLCLAAGAALILSGTPALAHHSFAAEFDVNRTVTLKGTVTKMDWVNPHVWIYMDVKDPNGTTVNWRVEAGNPNSLYRGGWTKSSLPVGAAIVIEGFGARDGTPTANARSVIFADGRKLFAGSNAPDAPPSK